MAHPLVGGGEMGDSEGQTLLGGGSSSSSSSEELSSVRSMTSTFLLLSLDDRLGSCVSVLDVSERKREVDTNTTQQRARGQKKNVLLRIPLSTPLKEADTSCTSFFDLMGAQFPSSLNWISSQSEQLFRISMNNLERRQTSRLKRWKAWILSCPHIAVELQKPSLPIYKKVLIRRLLVADRTDPGRLLLIHLDIKCCIKALEVRACYCSAGDRQPHLAQLEAQNKQRSAVMMHNRILYRLFWCNYSVN